MVDAAVPAVVAAQKLPKPCVGHTGVRSGRTRASRRAEACCAAASASVCCAPSRSGRPVEPNSKDPPVNTAATSPMAASSSTYARWVKVCPGVAMTRTRMDRPTAIVSPSPIPTRLNATASAALT
jgi:hypothetical protein